METSPEKEPAKSSHSKLRTPPLKGVPPPTIRVVPQWPESRGSNIIIKLGLGSNPSGFTFQFEATGASVSGIALVDGVAIRSAVGASQLAEICESLSSDPDPVTFALPYVEVATVVPATLSLLAYFIGQLPVKKYFNGQFIEDDLVILGFDSDQVKSGEEWHNYGLAMLSQPGPSE